MAKTSKIAKNEQRRKTVARYAERRAALKETIRTGAPEERAGAMAALQKLPVRMREMAHRGELPGVSKASW